MTHDVNSPWVVREHDWIVRDYRFRSGEVLSELRIHYATVGEPSGLPVLVLHGTTGSSRSMLAAHFAGELFGPGQPLDATRHYLIIPDCIGHGRSSRPSDGLRMAFPRYTYGDAVALQHRLVTEGLGIQRLRLVIGNSMGGMHAWLWGVQHPETADAIVAMACAPHAMAGRNWVTRRMIVESIRRDPAWNGGNYRVQPPAAQLAMAFFRLATNGGEAALQRAAPTTQLADRLVDRLLAEPFTEDANDLLYQWESGRDYDPSGSLDRIRAPVLAINSVDDERNPPELGLTERGLAHLRDGTYHLLPTGDHSVGHGTTANAALWKDFLGAWLERHPFRS